MHSFRGSILLTKLHTDSLAWISRGLEPHTPNIYRSSVRLQWIFANKIPQNIALRCGRNSWGLEWEEKTRMHELKENWFIGSFMYSRRYISWEVTKRNTWFYNEKIALKLLIGRGGNTNLLWSTLLCFWKGPTLPVHFNGVGVGNIGAGTNKCTWRKRTFTFAFEV